MKKHMLDMRITENIRLHADYRLIKLTAGETLPVLLPGQFVEVRVDKSPATFLRRPISIHYVDTGTNELWLLVQLVGDGTRQMAAWRTGDTVNILLPLGNGFTIPSGNEKTDKLLLIGGGVGVAPLFYLGDCLKKTGFSPAFLLGARSEKDLLQLDAFGRIGTVYTTTEDGSAGEKGYVTNHSILRSARFDRIYTCGPKPMMVAVARYAAATAAECEASLENTMACGIGACLCCVEKLNDGHNVCVCTEGPVFNIRKLSWLS